MTSFGILWNTIHLPPAALGTYFRSATVTSSVECQALKKSVVATNSALSLSRRLATGTHVLVCWRHARSLEVIGATLSPDVNKRTKLCFRERSEADLSIMKEKRNGMEICTLKPRPRFQLHHVAHSFFSCFCLIFRTFAFLTDDVYFVFHLSKHNFA